MNDTSSTQNPTSPGPNWIDRLLHGIHTAAPAAAELIGLVGTTALLGINLALPIAHEVGGPIGWLVALAIAVPLDAMWVMAAVKAISMFHDRMIAEAKTFGLVALLGALGSAAAVFFGGHVTQWAALVPIAAIVSVLANGYSKRVTLDVETSARVREAHARMMNAEARYKVEAAEKAHEILESEHQRAALLAAESAGVAAVIAAQAKAMAGAQETIEKARKEHGEGMRNFMRNFDLLTDPNADGFAALFDRVKSAQPGAQYAPAQNNETADEVTIAHPTTRPVAEVSALAEVRKLETVRAPIAQQTTHLPKPSTQPRKAPARGAQKVSEEDKAAALAKVRSGELSQRAAAQQLGVSDGSVRNWLAKTEPETA